MALRYPDLFDQSGEMGTTVAPETDWKQVSYEKQTPPKIQ